MYPRCLKKEEYKLNYAFTHSPQDMRAVGTRLSRQLMPGDVLLLSGVMGAGKSEFCRGIARGLGIEGPVTSPTFTILNVYEEGRIAFHHFDFYRIVSVEELFESGLDEQIGGQCITAIEWHERAPELMPENCLEVFIRPDDTGTSREIKFLARGAFRQLDYAAICGA